MLYSFKTSTTLKEKDRGKWWLDDDLVKLIELDASDLCWLGGVECINQVEEFKTLLNLDKRGVKHE